MSDSGAPRASTRRLRVLIMSRSPLHRDPRIQRQITALQSDYDLVCAGLTHPDRPGVDYVPVTAFRYSWVWAFPNVFRLLRGWREADHLRAEWVQELGQDLARVEFDMILANDIDMLPVARRVAAGRPIIYDAHEYAPSQLPRTRISYWLFSRYWHRTLKTHLPNTNAMMTVSRGIADLYRKNYGVEAEVVLNVPEYSDLEPRRSSGDLVHLVHHGGVSADRRIDILIDVMEHLDDRYRLTLMLVSRPDDVVFRSLVKKAAEDKRITFADPVSMSEIASTLNRFDIGLHLLKPSSLNNRFAMPNKIFEFIQARLAVVVGPSSSMSDMVQQHQIGRVSDSYSPKAVARAIASMDSEAIFRCKNNADRIALEFSAGPARKRILELVRLSESGLRSQ